MCFSKIQNGRKSNMADLKGSSGKVVEFDPKNVYTKFRVNRTQGVGVMHFKVKTCFSLIIVPPSGRLGSIHLGSICTQLPNKVQNFISLPFTTSQIVGGGESIARWRYKCTNQAWRNTIQTINQELFVQSSQNWQDMSTSLPETYP